MKLLIIEYLKFEMKNNVTELSNILKVFPPAKPDWNTLYAEFDSHATTQTVYWYTRFLKDKEHKVTMYVPHNFWAQFDHLSNIAHKYRVPPSVHKTKIRFGQKDMFLQVKPLGSHTWHVLHVPDLPTLTLQNHLPDMSISPSLAPGRSRSTAPKRPASSPASIRDPKALRSDSPHTGNNGGVEETENDDDALDKSEQSDPAGATPATQTGSFL